MTAIVGWESDGSPIHRKRVTPRLDTLRRKFWAVVAVIAAIVADEDLKRRVADAMGLDEDAAHSSGCAWIPRSAPTRSCGPLSLSNVWTQ